MTMAMSADDEAVLWAAVEAYDANQRAKYRQFVQRLAHRERDVLRFVWQHLASEQSARKQGGLTQVALDSITEASADLLRNLWQQVDPPRLYALVCISRDLLPWEYRWSSAVQSLHRDPASGREHAGTLGILVREQRSRRKQQAIVEDLLTNLDEKLIGPSVAQMLMDTPSPFASMWVLEHLDQVLSDGVRDPHDIEWNGLAAAIAEVLLAGGIHWRSVQSLIHSGMDRQRRVGAYVLAGHLNLESDCMHAWMRPRYNAIKDAPPRSECQGFLIQSNLLVECEIRGLG